MPDQLFPDIPAFRNPAFASSTHISHHFVIMPTPYPVQAISYLLSTSSQQYSARLKSHITYNQPFTVHRCQQSLSKVLSQSSHSQLIFSHRGNLENNALSSLHKLLRKRLAGGEGVAPPTHTHSLAGSVAINAKTTVHCAQGSSMYSAISVLNSTSSKLCTLHTAQYICTADTLYRKIQTNIPRNATATSFSILQQNRWTDRVNI
jgi:hypothetical protein